MKRNPADKSQRVLTAITLFIREHHYAPTLREICELADVSSTSLAAAHLERLQGAGLIEYEPGKARTIRLVHRA